MAAPAETAETPEEAAPAGDSSPTLSRARAGVAEGALSSTTVHPKTARPPARRVDDDPESRPVAHYHKPGTEPAQADSGLFLSVVGKLALVVALMFACAAGWKRLQGVLPHQAGVGAQGLQIAGTLPLGAQRALHVVQVAGRQLLIGATPHSITLICSLDEPGLGAAEPAFGSAGAEFVPAAGSYEAAGEWPSAGAADQERFASLLERLNHLETGQHAVEGRTDSRRDRLAGSETNGHTARSGPGTVGAGHSPGSLFRTAATAPRPERHA